MVLLLTFFHGKYGSTRGELMLFYGMAMEFKDKFVLYCPRKVKYKQGFTTGI